MRIDDMMGPFRKVFTANANSSAFPSKLPTATEPATDGVVNLTPFAGGVIPQRIILLPYGLGANNDVSDLKVIAWRRTPGSNTAGNTLWIPTTIGEFTCTFSGTAIGVAGGYLLNTEMFADTIVVKSAPLTPKRPGFDGASAATFLSDMVIYSPADDTVGYIILPLYGAEKFELNWDQTTGTPTNNALYALL